MFGQFHGTPRLMAGLLYGAGLRLMECIRLRIQDLDFPYRVTVLPQALTGSLQRQRAKTHALHEEDLAESYGEVSLPYVALPHALRCTPGPPTSKSRGHGGLTRAPDTCIKQPYECRAHTSHNRGFLCSPQFSVLVCRGG